MKLIRLIINKISLIGILLTELKFFGIPLRTPLILLGISAYRNPITTIILTLSLLLYVILSGLDVIFAKSNALTYMIITSGAILCSMLRSSLSAKNIDIGLSIIFVLSLLQIFGIYTIEMFFMFEDERALYHGRPKGLSSEPSFSAWMICYLLISRYAVAKSIGVLGYCVLVLHLIFGAMLTFVLVGIILLISYIYCNVKFNEFNLPIYPFVWGCLLFPFTLDILLRFYIGKGLGELLLVNFESWRELSHFSSIIGSSILNLPNFGEYEQLIYQGQAFLEGKVHYWINKPWSFFALQSLELGILPALIFYLLIWKNYNQKNQNSMDNAMQCTCFLIALIFGPKWAVYYLINPFKKLD